MGAKAWFIAYYNGDPKTLLSKEPKLDRTASIALAQKMFPDQTIEEKEDGSLTFLNPDSREVFVGVYGDLKIIAHEELGEDFPSRIDARWLDPDLGSTAYLHATHSVVDWCAFALWQNGKLARALSLSPDSGILEDIGDRLAFEQPYWDGSLSDEFEDEEFEDEDIYSFPFNPLDLSEAALLAMLGFQFEGYPDDWVRDPEEVPIMRFKIPKKSWWKFW